MKKIICLLITGLILQFGSESTFAQTPKNAPPKTKKPLPANANPNKDSQVKSVVTPPASSAAVKMDMPDKPEMKSKILPYPITQKKLPNGLNVVTVPYDSKGVVAFYIVVRVGSRNEIEPGKTGFAHFFEHMMFRGTKKYSKEKYSAVLKSTGASANANTSLDRTLYHMTGSSNKLETMFDLESDRFMNLDYSLQDFKTEAGAVKGEYTKNSSNPYTKLNEMIQNTAFSSHTYKHTTMGFWDDIVDMPNQYDYSRTFFNRYYRPEYCTIIVVGDTKAEEVNRLAETYFGSWKKGNYVSTVPPEPVQTATRFTHLQKPGFPPFLSLNYKGPAHNDAMIDLPALDILFSVYFSESADLYNNLVIRDQKARSVDGGVSNTRDPFLISIDASLVDTGDFKLVKETIMATLVKASTTPVDPQLLKEAKMNLKNSFKMSIDNPSAISQSLSSFTWLTGNPESLNNYYWMYDQVTADDLMKVAKKYFRSDRLTIGTISPNKNEKLK
ncbi:MAG: insulinase family protein [Bacteroidetes bacterium]|nr:insulinase family protein [Bacteroidota bacterium]